MPAPRKNLAVGHFYNAPFREACASLEQALRNLDYDVLRLDLTRGEDGENRLAIRLDGSAAEGKKKTPVNLRLNLNGDIEETINVAIEAAGLRPAAAKPAASAR